MFDDKSRYNDERAVKKMASLDLRNTRSLFSFLLKEDRTDDKTLGFRPEELLAFPRPFLSSPLSLHSAN